MKLIGGGVRNYREARVSNTIMVEILRKAGIDMPEDCVLLHVYTEPKDFGMGVSRYVFESKEFKEVPEGGEPWPWNLEAKEEAA